MWLLVALPFGLFNPVFGLCIGFGFGGMLTLKELDNTRWQSRLIAVLLGRVFCSWACPLNLFQEISDGLGRIFTRRARGAGRLRLPKWAIFVALAADFVIVVILGAPFFAIWSPPGLVGREIMMAVFYRTLALEGAVIVLVLLLNLITPRLFCR